MDIILYEVLLSRDKENPEAKAYTINTQYISYDQRTELAKMIEIRMKTRQVRDAVKRLSLAFDFFKKRLLNIDIQKRQYKIKAINPPSRY